jgi:hypothetical protein
MYFLWTKKSKIEATTHYFGTVFYKQVLEFHRPSKFFNTHLAKNIVFIHNEQDAFESLQARRSNTAPSLPAPSPSSSTPATSNSKTTDNNC